MLSLSVEQLELLRVILREEHVNLELDLRGLSAPSLETQRQLRIVAEVMRLIDDHLRSVGGDVPRVS